MVEEGTKSTTDPDSWFFPAERLAHAFPEWPWAKFRLAYAHLLLEDVDGALDLFEEAQRLAQAPDGTFDEWLKQFRAKVEEERQAEDRSWSEPEDGGVIAQFWNPPRDIDVFRCEGSPDAAATAVLLAEWNAYKESLGAGAAAKRYARLVAVQSSELEGVFLLGGGSLSNVVRDGLRAEAVDEVVQGPPSGVEGVIEILQDFDNFLRSFDSSSTRISHDDVKSIHAQLMRCSRIGYAEFPNEDPIPYLNTVGEYRRRIVTASMDTGDDDEPWRVVQFAQHQEVEAHMQTFLDMMNAKLTQVELENHDPFALAAWIHFNLAVIHPFTDGNGRVIRILASLPLLKAGLPYINVRPEVKSAYLGTLHKASRV
ncbi:hypothetical protein OH76DRAFT_1487644 [Lentinus brumalis]|uniref:protein adenylyltransferase n=1 Tax=Lentinus brumalis TaxID=2498619 RepID=A0A371CTX0_9APHY|nr:hypothetical protein OH76DRAFT_1487644 [Polyporus brumalis]